MLSGPSQLEQSAVAVAQHKDAAPGKPAGETEYPGISEKPGKNWSSPFAGRSLE